MESSASVRFFDAQFERQLAAGELQLNPFEQAALPFLQGHLLDFGCGLGNLALAAARRGCTVVALDGSAAAIAHLQALATARGLPITAVRAAQAAATVSSWLSRECRKAPHSAAPMAPA